MALLQQAAIRNFLSKPADNFNWLKTLTDQELDEELNALDPPPNFSTPLLKHQKVSFLLGVAHKSFFLQLDMGLGKSLISLELIKYFSSIKNQLVIILAPTDEVVLGWVD